MLVRDGLIKNTLINSDSLINEMMPSLQTCVKQATEMCNIPYAFICITYSDTLIIKAKIGFDEEIVLNTTIVKHTLNNPSFFQISDIQLDDKFKNQLPLIQNNTIHFYACSPLVTSNNEVIGALVIMDNIQKSLDERQISCLNLLSQNITSQLELQCKTNELETTTELFELISENNPDAIFAKDKDFKLLHVNAAFLELCPIKNRDEVIGFTTLEDYPKDDAEKFFEQDKIAFEKGISVVTEKILLSNGDIKFFHTTKKRLKQANGEDLILCIARDITEKEKLIQLLTKSNNDLDDFAHIASHDLKSPLNAIKSLVEWIEEDTEGKLDPESLKHFEMIKNRVVRIRRLLDDILNYSKIGRSDDEIQTVNLQNLVVNCYGLLDIPESYIITTDDISVTLPITPLEIVLTNLISNSIKHHNKQDATIKVMCNDEQHYYKIIVEDNGPGIDPKFHKRIFKRFSKLKSNDEVDGSGLGLAIVTKILDFYSATIEIESDIGEGCKMIINWPKADKVSLIKKNVKL